MSEALMERLGGIRIPDLAAVRACERGTPAEFYEIAKDAAFFVLDARESFLAFLSAGESPLTELPPLPVEQIVVEPWHDPGSPISGWPLRWSWAEHWLEGAARPEEPFDGFLALAVQEVEQGSVWEAVALRPKETWRFRVFAGGSTTLYMETEKPSVSLDELREKAAEIDASVEIDDLGRGRIAVRSHTPDSGFLNEWIVEAVHLITARGVTNDEVPLPRPIRRSLERQGATSTIHIVRIGGERSVSIPRDSGREYHVRWLVRGHWRQYESGKRSWVRPYIKGPAGAPWKGRPVYDRTRSFSPVTGQTATAHTSAVAPKDDSQTASQSEGV